MVNIYSKGIVKNTGKSVERKLKKYSLKWFETADMIQNICVRSFKTYVPGLSSLKRKHNYSPCIPRNSDNELACM